MMKKACELVKMERIMDGLEIILYLRQNRFIDFVYDDGEYAGGVGMMMNV